MPPIPTTSYNHKTCHASSAKFYQQQIVFPSEDEWAELTIDLSKYLKTKHSGSIACN